MLHGVVYNTVARSTPSSGTEHELSLISFETVGLMIIRIRNSFRFHISKILATKFITGISLLLYLITYKCFVR